MNVTKIDVERKSEKPLIFKYKLSVRHGYTQVISFPS